MKTQEWKDCYAYRNIGIRGSNAKYETGMKELRVILWLDEGYYPKNTIELLFKGHLWLDEGDFPKNVHIVFQTDWQDLWCCTEMSSGLFSVSFWLVPLIAGPNCTAEGKDGSQCQRMWRKKQVLERGNVTGVKIVTGAGEQVARCSVMDGFP